jgi:hypothetical protein
MSEKLLVGVSAIRFDSGIVGDPEVSRHSAGLITGAGI